MSVSYDVIGSDHRPLSFCIFADVNLVEESIDDNKAYAVVPDWKARDEHKMFSKYYTDVDHHLRRNLTPFSLSV